MSDMKDAKAALEQIRQTREQTLGKMDYWPWWYDAGYALACGLLVAGPGFSTTISMACVAVAIAILVTIMRVWQDRTGVWVNGYTPRRARWAAFGLAAILVGLIGVNLWFGRVQGMVWVPLASGLAAAALGVVGMRIWMRLYRIDVRSLS